jgi:hypothetical protein
VEEEEDEEDEEEEEEGMRLMGTRKSRAKRPLPCGFHSKDADPPPMAASRADGAPLPCGVVMSCEKHAGGSLPVAVS